ncbi:MAG: hypothetical protein PF541_19220 [Prolixibacteraceae bacterium]|jgi:hypothetical protein|nr:hypothetical protein [Prolixibacteraceae bacterium]
MKKGLCLILLFFLLYSCIGRYGDFELETDSEFIAPFAFGSYSLGDLFYEFEDTVNVSTGQFFQLSDTIPLNEISLLDQFNEVEILFQSTNLMPFQVDLDLTPFDSIQGVLNNNSIHLTIVEAATTDNQLSLLIPTYWENTIYVNQDLLNSIRLANSLLIEVTFIWPYESVSVKLNDELKAFDLAIILKINL